MKLSEIRKIWRDYEKMEFISGPITVKSYVADYIEHRKMRDKSTQLEADNAALETELSKWHDSHWTEWHSLEECPGHVAALQEQVKRLPGIKIADGTVWLVFPDAIISIDAIGSGRGPIVRKNLRAWRDKILESEGE